MRYRNYITILFLLSTTIATAENGDLNTILNGVFRNQDKMDSEIKDATFDGSFFYIEKNDNGQILKTINSKRRIYSKGYDKQKSEYSEMMVNGKILTPEQMKKELKKSRGDMQTKLPFTNPFRYNYDFSYLGEENWNNKRVWKVGYKPKYKGKDNIQGFAYIQASDTNVVQYQFVPVGLPFVLKHFNIILDYSKTDEYWVPTKFSLDMELDVRVVISLSHKLIHMQEDYSNYKFNTNLPDNFFEIR